MKKQKTITEWLMMLPVEYRRRAIYNYHIENIERDFSSDIMGSFSNALSNAFSWIDTPEGYVFWEEVSRWDPYVGLPPIFKG